MGESIISSLTGRRSASEIPKTPAELEQERYDKLIAKGAPEKPPYLTVHDALEKVPTADEKVFSLDEVKHDVEEAKKAKLTGQTGPKFGSRARAWLYKKIDIKTDGIEHFEAQFNDEFSKYTQETVRSGPDDNFRFIIADETPIYNADGSPKLDKKGNPIVVMTHFDSHGTKPLTHTEIKIRKRIMKEMSKNPALYQAVGVYNVSKFKEKDQGRGWENMVNTMWQMGFSWDRIHAMYTGIKYTHKGSMLTAKHRSPVHPLLRNERGEVQMDAAGKPIADRSRVVLGPINTVEYVSELAEKLKTPYELTFSSADVQAIRDMSKDVVVRADKYFYTPELRGKADNTSYREALYALAHLKYVVDESTMGGSAESLDTEKILEQVSAQEEMLARRGQQMTYPPKITGSAVANWRWRQLAKIVNDAADRYPGIMASGPADYEDFSSIDKYHRA